MKTMRFYALLLLPVLAVISGAVLLGGSPYAFATPVITYCVVAPMTEAIFASWPDRVTYVAGMAVRQESPFIALLCVFILFCAGVLGALGSIVWAYASIPAVSAFIFGS